MKRIAIAVLAFAGVALGQRLDGIPPSDRTDGWFNCRFWQVIGEAQKVGMILGYSDMWGQESSEKSIVVVRVLSNMKVSAFSGDRL